MSDWTVDEHLNAGGRSYFAEFVAGLADAQDVKDAAVLVAPGLGESIARTSLQGARSWALRASWNQGADLLRFFAWQARRSSRWVCKETG
jgi:hypothetical protein